jgi:predicted RNA-binding Zn ribbon-like protein
MTSHIAQNPTKFAWIGGRLALDFANTTSWEPAGPRNERLLTLQDLLDWGRDAALIFPERHAASLDHARRNPLAAQRALERALLVRELLHRLFTPIADGHRPDAQLVAAFNDQLPRSLARLRLSTDADALVWADGADDLDTVIHQVMWSAAKILSSPDRQRLRRCANDACGWHFVDESRNHMRKWCEMRECGNRAKARRHYARRRNRASRPS